MPGIIGYFSQDNKDIMEVLANMLESLCVPDNSIKEQWYDLEIKGGIGRAVLDSVLREAQSISSEDEQKKMFLKGDVYGISSCGLLRAYEDKGLEFLASNVIDGAFAGAILDMNEHRLLFFTDPFGLEPLYYYVHNGSLAFASEIKALLAVPDFSTEIDLKTLANFWSFGFALEDRTPFHKVRVLPPGSLYLFDLKSRNGKVIPYWHLESLFLTERTGFSGTEFELVAEAFWGAVQKRSQDVNEARLGLSLSGGLDSRAILGGLGERGRNIRTYTLGLPGCADQHLAAKMAGLSGSSHDFIPIEEKGLEDFESMARLMVTLSDGLYHPHESTEIVALNYLATRPFDIMLRGHGGEIAKAALAYPVQATKEMLTLTPHDVVLDLYKRASLAKRDMDWGRLLRPTIFDQVQGQDIASLRHAAEPAIASGLSNVDICLYLYIGQWIRRQVVASLCLFRKYVEIRLPYLDREFLAVLLKLPREKRWSGEFHHYFVQKYAPSLIRVPDSNTGAPLDAGPFRLALTDKVNAVLRRLGVRGFRHYTEFQDWQRKYFSKTTESILFNEQTLDRGYYSPEGLREVYELHVSGRRNYGHFLGTAVAIELWHRIFDRSR